MSLSAATSPKGLSPQVAKDSLAYLRQAIERMKSLQATDHVFVCLEQAQLQRAPEKLKLKALVTAINSLNLALREGIETKVDSTRAVVQQELEAAVANLVRRDARVMTYNLRRYCEAEATLLDLQSLAALASFYYLLPFSESSRSKYDFVITQLFSLVDEQRQRHLKGNPEQISKRLTTMCQAWEEGEERESADPLQVMTCLQEFAVFMAEMETIPTLGALVSSAFFQRMRDFKTSLGPLFFTPEVTAASVEANVAFANGFLTLLRKESQAFCEAPEVLPLAEAFSDPYASEPDEIARILTELQTHPQESEEAQARVTRLTQLLQLTEEERLSPSLIAEPVLRQPDNLTELPSDLPPADDGFSGELLPKAAETVIEVAAEPIAEVAAEIAAETAIETATDAVAEAATSQEVVAADEALEAFAAQPENEVVIAAYRCASPAVRELELACFLSPLPEDKHEELKREEQARRTSLELILQADQLHQSVKSGEGVSDARVETLLDALGQCGDDMRDLIKISHTHEQDKNYEVFLHIYNQLMATRLRLQSALVRRSTNEVVPDDPQEEETTLEFAQEAAPEAVSETDAEETVQTPTRNANRKWMVVVAIVLIAVALGIRFLTMTEAKAPPKDDTDVVRVAQKDLPHGALFADIKLHRDLLLCVATEEWLTLGSADQKRKLQDLLQFAQQQQAKRVLLIDAKGLTVASATSDEVYVN